MLDNPRNFFSLHKDYTGEKQFSLPLRKLDGTPANFFSSKINLSFIICAKKNTKRRKSMEKLIVKGSFIALGIKDFNQLITLNPLYINIGNSVIFVDFARKYPQKLYIFRFKLLSITLLSNIANLDEIAS